MAAETNLQKSVDFAKVSAIDFTATFKKNIDVLLETLGITRKIEKKPGQVIKTYKVVGQLESGAVGEGEEIPLSHFETEVADLFEITYGKYRKSTSYEAIAEKGYKQAVLDTDDEMLRQIQSGVRKNFFDFVKTGTGKASGKGLRAALAQTRAQLKVKTEDYGLSDSDYIYFMNPLDTADYLGEESNLTTQDVYGMTYIEKFLNLYDVVERTDIPQGTIAATTKNNLILYYINVNNSDISQAFDFVADETGLIGITREVHKSNLTTDTVAVLGTGFFAELIDWVVLGEIKPFGGETEKAPEKTLDDMTVDELKAYAAKNSIDTTGKTTKADILAAIKAAEATE